MVGLGIETAIELANAPNDEGRDELIAKLEAIHSLSKSTMWELGIPLTQALSSRAGSSAGC